MRTCIILFTFLCAYVDKINVYFDRQCCRLKKENGTSELKTNTDTLRCALDGVASVTQQVTGTNLLNDYNDNNNNNNNYIDSKLKV